MENTTKKNKISSFLGIIQIVIVLVSIGLSIYFYQNFPATVPIHWNIVGEADNWASKGFGAFMFPVLLVAIYFLFELLPKIDPRKERYVEFAKVYSIIKTAIMLVFFGVFIITGLNSLGYAAPVNFWIPFMIGLLFIVTGNYFGKIRSNYFVGIKVPWTLANEEVWNKTHRLGGKMFILGGITFMFTGLAPAATRVPLLIVIIAIIVVLPIVYSYFLYKKLQKINQ